MTDSSNTEVDSQVDESTESETTSNSTSTGTSSMDSSIGTTSSTSTETSSMDSSIGTTSSTSTGTSGASVESTTSGNGTTSNSNENFSDGLPGLGGGSWTTPASETEAAHASGVQGPGLANGDFGSSWSGNGNSGSGSGDYTYNDTSYSNNKSEPVMTVDEVYGKITETGVIGNQSIVESQGDYNATSNEKSNVETSTFGKQDDITVTPESVTENKGLVNNAAIESIEGLNFQQKDKESQDVMEARKSRDEAEAEDKANQMRDSLKAKTKQTAEKDAEEDNNAFKVGDRDEELAAAKTKADEAQTSMKNAIAANDIHTYIEAQKQYNKNLNEALQIGNSLTQTDYNKGFVNAVAKANDFTVTLADGTQKEYSQFATEMSTKSPEIAKAMYEAKAQKYEAENHPVLANIERAKAAMVETWIGSKLTMVDNQVRNQFNQMAKTNMRATYAAYNNVLNDVNATPEQKAKASAEIDEANALMTASTALKASTGFWSGIGDSMKDGVYGKTDPQTLNAYQKTLNAVDNLAKITLGLGVSPGANRAYQNMYYMAGDKVNKSNFFNRDWDGDGFALCQEYGNSAAAGMIAGAGELATGVALFFNPAMVGMGLNLVIDSFKTFTNGLYGVQKDVRKSQQYTKEVLSYFEEAKDIAEQSGNKEAVDTISDGITQIENFELKSDEVGNLNNWLEGSGSNTADNGKFNQALTYDEWLKLIEADPTMRDYAKKLIAEKKEK